MAQEKVKHLTAEVLERFWFWCGLRRDNLGWYMPREESVPDYYLDNGLEIPPPDMNNLVRFAVPKLGGGTDLSISFREIHWTNGQVFTECVISRNFMEIGRASIEGSLEGVSAQAFFWAVYKVAGLKE